MSFALPNPHRPTAGVFSLLFLLLGLGIAAQSRELGARYALPLLAIALALPFVLAPNRPLFKKSEMLLLGAALALCGISVIGCSQGADALYSFAKVATAFLYFFTTLAVGNALSAGQITRTIHTVGGLACLLLLIEFARKYVALGGTVFEVSQVLGDNFYLAKTTSFMFFDTNALAIYALLALAVLLALRERYPALIQLPLILMLIIFVAMSLSRAAIIAMAVLLGLYVVRQSTPSIRLTLIVCFAAAALVTADLLLDSSFFAGSGQRKLDTYLRLGDLFPRQPLATQLFGAGVSEGNYLYSDEDGGYSHTLVTMLLGQIGLVGLTLYVLFWVGVFGIYGMSAAYIAVPAFVAGLSYMHPFYETIFWCTAVVLLVFERTHTSRMSPVKRVDALPTFRRARAQKGP